VSLPVRIWLTGSRGLVGREVKRHLENRGLNVLTDYSEVGSRVDLCTIELGELIHEPPTHIVHVAAAIPSSRGTDDQALFDTNRQIDRNVLRAALRWNAKTIYISTCGLYLRDRLSWQTESSRVLPRSPYFESKKVGEEEFLRLRGGVVLRISSPYGDGLPANIVLGKFIQRAKKGLPIVVWGSGRREQDFVSTSDVATAIEAALTSRSEGVFNIAAGEPTTMLDLAHQISAITRTPVHLAGQPDPSEFERIRISVSKAKAQLAWAPVSDLASWIRSQSENYE
jgi:UDP-glucose 4-epimerase